MVVVTLVASPNAFIAEVIVGINIPTLVIMVTNFSHDVSDSSVNVSAILFIELIAIATSFIPYPIETIFVAQSSAT